MFNKPENAEGALITILVASEVLEEGHTVKCVRHQITLGLPDDLASYKQLRGRVDRRDSHEDLAKDKRDVTFYVLITEFVLPADAPREVTRYGVRGWDLERWRRAAEEYGLTREIEKTIHEVALAAGQLGALKGLKKEDPLDALPFEPGDEPTRALACRRWTYYAYGYDRPASAAIAEAVKNLFAEVPVWTYASLIGRLRAEPRPAPLVAYDTAQLSDQDIAAAVTSLLWRPQVEALAATGRPNTMIAERGKYLVLATQAAGMAHEGGGVFFDYDAAQRMATRTGAEPRAAVDISAYVKLAKRRYNFQIYRDEWLADLETSLAKHKLGAEEAAARVAADFTNFSADFHYALLAELVQGQSTADRRLFTAMRPAMLRAYGMLGFIVHASAVRKGDLDRVGRQVAAGKITPGVPAPPVGYVTAAGGVLLTKQGGWVTIPRAAVDALKGRAVREAALVGVLEEHSSGPLAFKLKAGRPGAASLDRRTIERGMSCASHKKEYLVDLARKLGASRTDNASVSTLCRLIRAALLLKEIKSRRGDSQVVTRYVHLFNEPN